MPSHGFPCWDLLRQFHNTPHTTSYSHVSNDIQSVNSPGFNCCGCGCQGLWLERLAVLRCSQWIKVPATKQLPAMSPTCQISRNLCDTKTSFERSSNLSTNYCWLFSLYPHCIPIVRNACNLPKVGISMCLHTQVFAQRAGPSHHPQAIKVEWVYASPGQEEGDLWGVKRF